MLVASHLLCQEAISWDPIRSYIVYSDHACQSKIIYRRAAAHRLTTTENPDVVHFEEESEPVLVNEFVLYNFDLPYSNFLRLGVEARLFLRSYVVILSS